MFRLFFMCQFHVTVKNTLIFLTTSFITLVLFSAKMQSLQTPQPSQAKVIYLLKAICVLQFAFWQDSASPGSLYLITEHLKWEFYSEGSRTELWVRKPICLLTDKCFLSLSIQLWQKLPQISGSPSSRRLHLKVLPPLKDAKELEMIQKQVTMTKSMRGEGFLTKWLWKTEPA